MKGLIISLCMLPFMAMGQLKVDTTAWVKYDSLCKENNRKSKLLADMWISNPSVITGSVIFHGGRIPDQVSDMVKTIRIAGVKDSSAILETKLIIYYHGNYEIDSIKYKGITIN